MASSPFRPGSRLVGSLIGLALVSIVSASVVVVAQSRREFDVSARKYAYTVSGSASPEIRVSQNDLVHITFSAEDIPHSFTVRDSESSHYRIMRRAEPGRPVSFDFRADTPGTFVFYCSLTIDDNCRQMEGRLIVEPAR